MSHFSKIAQKEKERFLKGMSGTPPKPVNYTCPQCKIGRFDPIKQCLLCHNATCDECTSELSFWWCKFCVKKGKHHSKPVQPFYTDYDGTGLVTFIKTPQCTQKPK